MSMLLEIRKTQQAARELKKAEAQMHKATAAFEAIQVAAATFEDGRDKQNQDGSSQDTEEQEDEMKEQRKQPSQRAEVTGPWQQMDELAKENARLQRFNCGSQTGRAHQVRHGQDLDDGNMSDSSTDSPFQALVGRGKIAKRLGGAARMGERVHHPPLASRQFRKPPTVPDLHQPRAQTKQTRSAHSRLAKSVQKLGHRRLSNTQKPASSAVPSTNKEITVNADQASVLEGGMLVLNQRYVRNIVTLCI
jgi:hypothetical protein